MSIYVGTSEIKNIYVGTTPVKEVYVGTTKVRPSGRQPTANTVVYYPLTTSTTTTDKSGHGYNLTNSGSGVTFGTYQGVNCASFNQYNLYHNNIPTLPQGNTARTISFWLYDVGTDKAIFQWGNQSGDNVIAGYVRNTGRFSDSTYYGGSFNGSTYLLNAWHNVVLTSTGSVKTIYVDGVADGSSSTSYNTSGYTLYLGKITWASSYNYNGYLSNFIIENRAWSASDVSTYYNLTKSTYGK